MTDSVQPSQQPPQNGIQVVIVLNNQQNGAYWLPLPDTYAKAEQGLRDLLSTLRDVLARIYDEQARAFAVEQYQRAEELVAKVARLEAELAQAKEE